jgi:hypothetical protein
MKYHWKSFATESLERNKVMRAFLLTTTIVLTATVVPALAQTSSYGACEALAEQRGGDLGGTNHRLFIRDCMSGKIPMSTPAVNPPTKHVLDAESFGRCWTLAEQRGSTTGGSVYRQFMKQCMDGEIR